VSYNTWTPHAVLSEAQAWRPSAWRIVEAQHVASTMKIVDNQNEQDVLEELLESSKPALPKAGESLDYLLASPFRYDPRRGGSRFRSNTDPGVFYGAANVHTACAELGYWRWKFLKDAVDLIKLEPVAHTAFQVDISATMVDLRKPPFATDATAWTHPTDYTSTQSFARTTRDAGVTTIVYQSVRDPKPSWCVAVLSPAAFHKPKPHPAMQTWWLAVYQDSIIWRREREKMTFTTAAWQI